MISKYGTGLLNYWFETATLELEISNLANLDAILQSGIQSIWTQYTKEREITNKIMLQQYFAAFSVSYKLVDNSKFDNILK